ncbi:uncharacterized protein LOC130995274 [Salvia miltiorrhiza]|uniref:uncharacterized protein LOC130995274 n=1 Tax=Salvia miltiorrhiza TaxID=226208 RepID=UPI0025AC942D|nr:uncharacterized protein LOC130995274 [Salvia miltiorrhiza]
MREDPQSPTHISSSYGASKDENPHYLRASIGSCHDLCKFRKQHSIETKARKPIRFVFIYVLVGLLYSLDHVLSQSIMYLISVGCLCRFEHAPLHVLVIRRTSLTLIQDLLKDGDEGLKIVGHFSDLYSLTKDRKICSNNDPICIAIARQM